jgi:hypothetical protein
MAAIDMGPSLVTQMVASVAAMDFPNGNDAPNSSGCPNGTGTAPQPCAAPGEAGCIPYQPEPPTVRQAPPKTFDGIVGRILRLEEPPDEIGPYSLAYHIKHDIVNPTRKWLANEPQVYLDAENNVRTSSVHRDYSHEMAPVLAEVVLMVVPGTNALARGESLAPRAGGALPDAALVCRGGTCTAERFINGSGVAIDAAGRLSGVSVNAGTGSLAELTATLRYKQVGVTTVGKVRAAGGLLEPKPTPFNPLHHELSDLTGEQLQHLFTPTVRNPNF